MLLKFILLLVAVSQENHMEPSCIDKVYVAGDQLRAAPLNEHPKLVAKSADAEHISACAKRVLKTAEETISDPDEKKVFPYAFWASVLWIQASEGEESFLTEIENTESPEISRLRSCMAIGFCAFNAPVKKVSRSNIENTLCKVIRNTNLSWGTRVEALIALRRFEVRFPGIFNSEIKNYAQENIVFNADFESIENELKRVHEGNSFTAKLGVDYGKPYEKNPFAIVKPFPGWDETIAEIRTPTSGWRLALWLTGLFIVIPLAITIVAAVFLCSKLRAIMPQ